mmetsp:Transcript_497/g.728  ORF Transcript_497/g.728 Transcript_497/m.728 type:complete len:218 (-) Transcript_497:535-1188(-)
MVSRASEFSPVKNKPGIGKMDAPDVARADVNRYHISLLKAAGYQITPQGRGGAVITEVMESEFSRQTLEDFSRLNNSLGAPKFVLVYGAYVDIGNGKRESWCPDTTIAMGLINKELKDVFAESTYFMLKLPVERHGYKGNPQHPYRLNQQLKITGVPTLYLWYSNGPLDALTLNDSGCQDASKIKHFFRYARTIMAPNVTDVEEYFIISYFYNVTLV